HLFWARAASVGEPPREIRPKSRKPSAATAPPEQEQPAPTKTPPDSCNPINPFPPTSNIRVTLVNLILVDTFRRDKTPNDIAHNRSWTISWTLRPRGVGGVGAGRQRSGVDAALRRINLVPVDEMEGIDPEAFVTDMVGAEARARSVVYVAIRDDIRRGWAVGKNRGIVHKETEMV
ncbi:hypothetical protein BDK51DRAFT_33801, partial [Blyttiomyces helicus]